MRYGDLRVWTEDWDGTPVIGAEGEIDLGNVDTLRTTTSEVVRAGPKRVIFDFRKVTFMDSSGLGILVATRKRLGSAPGAVTVISDQPAVVHSLSITGLDRVFSVQSEAPVPSGSAS